MDIQTLTSFFMWCTIINAAIYTLWAVIFICMPDWLYRVQSKWFPMPRETFTVVLYAFMGVFKIMFILFNLIPFIALLIIG